MYKKVACGDHFRTVLELECSPFVLKEISQHSDGSHSDFELKFLN